MYATVQDLIDHLNKFDKNMHIAMICDDDQCMLTKKDLETEFQRHKSCYFEFDNGLKSLRFDTLGQIDPENKVKSVQVDEDILFIGLDITE